MFVDAVRRYADAAADAERGWLAGLRDRFVGRALALMHEEPARDWTSTSSAAGSACRAPRCTSASSQLIGVPPMQYLAQWRMQAAARLLLETRATVAAIAVDVGYDSEAAFARAFKRLVGKPPAAWRRERRQWRATHRARRLSRSARRPRPRRRTALAPVATRAARRRRCGGSRRRRRRRRDVTPRTADLRGYCLVAGGGTWVERIDAVVVGAGAVGLAVARELALRGRETIVLEAGPGIGNGTSSRNSEVIHAGLYDAPGSLKATLCVSGREALYPYCESRGVGHRRCGKLVVAATPAQVETLKAIEARATTNGVRGLRWLSGAEARAARAGAAGRGGAALERHRHHRQPRAHAGATRAISRTPAARWSCARRSRTCGRRSDGGFVAARRRRRARRVCAPACSSTPRGCTRSRWRAASKAWTRRTVPRPWFAKGNYFALAGRSHPYRASRTTRT